MADPKLFKIAQNGHLFKENGNGIEMTDIIHYKLPLWILGDIANSLFVKKQLAKIFDYRFKKAEELFGKK